MMKATGIIRKIDGLGRIVLPKGLRKMMQIDTGDYVEFCREDDIIVVKKYRRGRKDGFAAVRDLRRDLQNVNMPEEIKREIEEKLYAVGNLFLKEGTDREVE